MATPSTGPRDLARKIASLGPEKRVDLSYIHDGAQKMATLTLGTLPAEKTARADLPTARAEPTQLAKFGMTLRGGHDGVTVASVDPDGSAAQKGVRQGDVILEAAGKPVTSPADVQSALATARKDNRKAVLLRLKTGETTHFVALATDPAA